MPTTSGGYILVLRDRRSAWAGARVHVSRFPGELWLARARRLLRHGRRIPPALRLVSSHYADDPACVRVQLAAMLGPRFAERGRAGEARLRRMLNEALAQDRTRLEARFDPETGLFRTPGDALPAPVKRLVAQLRREIVARTSARRRIPAAHLRHPYAVGLLWPLLGDRLEEAGIPVPYRAETWRALLRAVAGCHLTGAEMTATLEAVNAQPAEYRVGAWEYRRFSRGRKDAKMPGLDRTAFYLLGPQDHMKRGFADYRRRVHGSVPVRLAIWSFRVLQVAACAATTAGVAWLLLRVPNGLMPGLTLFFAAGAAIIAGRLYRRPDMAKLFGRVSERALERARTTLETAPVSVAPPPASAPSGPTAPGSPASGPAIPPVPRGRSVADYIPHPADIPAPMPAPAPVRAAASPEADRTTATHAAGSSASVQKNWPSVEEMARAWMAAPFGGAIPYPVPRMAAESEAKREPATKVAESTADGHVRAETHTEDCAAMEGAFVLGWGMPIPVPNWMAASAPAAPPPSARQVKDGKEAEKAIRNAGIFHAPPLPPVLPSAAFWGIEGTGLPTGAESRPGSGDGGDSSRRRDS